MSIIKKRFKVDARALLTLGRDSIKDHTTAIIELVKNSYDADASIVEIKIKSESAKANFIRIADNGFGMSEAVVENNWLRIGYSEKRSRPKSKGLRRDTTGEKGIGRLSADRLGRKLKIISKASRSPAVGLEVDWTMFESAGRELGDIEFPLIQNPSPKLPEDDQGLASKTGTELLITDLRQKWTADDVKRLQQELSLLLPPYAAAANFFSIRFENDVVPELNGAIVPTVSAAAEVTFDGKLEASGVLRFSLTRRSTVAPVPSDRPRTVPRLLRDKSLQWSQINPGLASGKAAPVPSVLGPLDIKLSFYLRKADSLDGSGINLGQLRSFLDNNAGVRIYRDMIRVKPYGDPTTPEGDWLGLSERRARNPAGAGRDDFRVASTQIVGAVLISKTRNKKLIDSSSREGLIDGDALRQLRSVVMAAISQIEAFYHAAFSKDNPGADTPVAKAKVAVVNLRSELTNLRADLSSKVPLTAAQVSSVIEILKVAEKDIEELASQNTVYRGLASVGIAAAVFGHETETAVDMVQGGLTLARLSLQAQPAKVEVALAELNTAESSLQQVASWGKFALRRVNKDKRQKRKMSIKVLMEAILTELAAPLRESNIELTRKLEDVSARTFAMDIEAVVVNFVTNSYFAVKKVKSGRKIEVVLKSRVLGGVEGFEISVMDSGPGFQGDLGKAIWEPLFSTRTDNKGRQNGTGLGLSIVKSAVEELGGKVDGRNGSRLGGALFSAWFPG